MGSDEGAERVAIRLADAHYRRGTSEEEMARSLGLAASGPVGGGGGIGAQPAASGGGDSSAVRESLPPADADSRAVTDTSRKGNRDQRLQMIGTRVEGAGLIQSGRVADGAALLETTIPLDPVAENDERAVELAVMLSAAYLAMGAWGEARRSVSACCKGRSRPAMKLSPPCIPSSWPALSSCKVTGAARP